MWLSRCPRAPVHGKLHAPASDWATETCTEAGSIEVYHIHATLRLLGLAFCGLAHASCQKASQEQETLQCHAGELTRRSL